MTLKTDRSKIVTGQFLQWKEVVSQGVSPGARVSSAHCILMNEP